MNKRLYYKSPYSVILLRAGQSYGHLFHNSPSQQLKNGVYSSVGSASVRGSGGSEIDFRCRPVCGLGPPVGIVRCEVGSRTLTVALMMSRSPPVNGVNGVSGVGGERNKKVLYFNLCSKLPYNGIPNLNGPHVCQKLSSFVQRN